MYICGKFQDATVYGKKVTKEEVEHFDQPSRIRAMQK